MKHPKRYCRSPLPAVAALLVLSALAPGQAETPAGKQGADQVPSSQLRTLRAKWVSPDAKMTDADKIRRYESILRTGRQIVRGHPEAVNLYMVRAVMLQATRGLLMLNVTDIDREGVIRLAQDIVDSQAPPAWRFEADTLLVQVRSSEKHAQGEDPRSLIDEYVDRYEDTKVIARAVMRACDMAQMYEDRGRTRDYMRKLQRELIYHPGVGSYLRRNGQKVSPVGRSFRGRLALVGGGHIQFPLQAMGRTTLVVFWDPKSPRGSELVADIASYVRFNRDRDLRALGIAIGDDQELIAKTARQARADFPQAYLPLASESPVLETFGITEIPMFLLIGSDGRVHSVPRHHTGIRWSDTYREAEEHIQRNWRKRDRFKATRCGLFLLEELSGQAGPDVRRLLDETIEARMIADPERRRRFITIQGRIAELEPQATQADRARLRILQIMMDRWQKLSENTQAAQESWTHDAHEVLDDSPDPATALLADYFATLPKAHQSEDASRAITAFAGRHAEGPVAWAAEILTVVLGFEAGLDDIHQGYRNELIAERTHIPRVRGFLRDVLDYNSLELLAPQSFTLTDLEGRKLRIPEDFAGTEGFVVHFWKDQAPIASAGRYYLVNETQSVHTLQSAPTEKIKIIAIHVGQDIGPARKLAAKRPGWIHIHAKDGWDNPLMRKLDVTRLPSSWLLGRLGSVLATDRVVDLSHGLEDLCDHGTFWARNLTGYNDWELHFWRLTAYLQTLKTSPEMFGPEKVEWITRQREDHLERTLRWVDEASSAALDREHQRVANLLAPMLSLRRESFKPVTPQEVDLMRSVVERYESIQERLERVDQLIRSDLWDPVRSYRENPIPERMKQIWHYNELDRKLSQSQQEFLDSIFQRLEHEQEGRLRWRVQIPPGGAQQ